MGRMLEKMMLAAGAMTAAITGGAAFGQERAVRLSQAAIMSGDLSTAERTLVAERRIHPQRAEVLLNLAAVYARSGRGGEAIALYRNVLANDDVLMDMPSGKVASAHLIARTGLGAISPTVATR